MIVNGVKCPCLVDTGSMVTACSLAFVKRNLPHIKVESLQNLIKIEGAAGHNIPYVGYMDVTMSFKEGVSGVMTDFEVPALQPENTYDGVDVRTNVVTAFFRKLV